MIELKESCDCFHLFYSSNIFNGKLFNLSFFGSPWAALLVAGLLMMMLARAGRWAGIDALLAISNPKGKLW